MTGIIMGTKNIHVIRVYIYIYIYIYSCVCVYMTGITLTI